MLFTAWSQFDRIPSGFFYGSFCIVTSLQDNKFVNIFQSKYDITSVTWLRKLYPNPQISFFSYADKVILSIQNEKWSQKLDSTLTLSYAVFKFENGKLCTNADTSKNSEVTLWLYLTGVNSCHIFVKPFLNFLSVYFLRVFLGAGSELFEISIKFSMKIVGVFVFADTSTLPYLAKKT